jgi:DNA-binding transcriptional LysR family regulator
MKQYDPNDLLIFARIVETGSFSRAAQRMGLPKSTLSRRLSLLEDQLGERLLLRTTRRLQVTEFGERLLEHARQVADEVESVRALVEHRQARPSGRLRISMPSDLANLLLSGMLHDFITAYPAVSLDLDLSPRRVDILGENFDLAIRVGDLPDATLLAARRIAVFSMGLYAAPSYLAARGEPDGPDDLVRHEALCLSGPHGGKASWPLSSGKERRDEVPPGRFIANSPELLTNLARAGAGIAALPDYFTRPFVQRNELRRVLPAWSLPPHTAWAVFPGRRLMPAKTRAFIDMLQTALAGAPRTIE